MQPISFDPALPVNQKRDDIRAAIDDEELRVQHVGFAVPLEVVELESRGISASQTDEHRPKFRVLVVDPLPAGLEIENPNISEGISTDGLEFTKSDLAPVFTEARDDRYVASFDRVASQKPEFSVAYVVRAVTPGRYVHPAPVVEDMYRPDRFGRGASGLIEVQSAR
jgi:hypothetical protein